MGCSAKEGYVGLRGGELEGIEVLRVRIAWICWTRWNEKTSRDARGYEVGW
jgi:hypothetical protein